jgi:acetylglutamate kinase
MSKTIVIKFGGSIATDPKIKKGFYRDIATLHKQGYKVVICHGGGPEINNFLLKLGLKPKFVNGLRVTDKETMEIVEMVLCGKVNKEIVGALSINGAPSVGISGKDASLLIAKKMKTTPDLGFVGEITKVNTKVLNDLLKDYVVVVSSLGIDAKEQTYNINADTVATKIAQALKADKLVLLTNVKGVLADATDEFSTIMKIKTSQIAGLIKNNVVSGGMIPKMLACREALARGVKEIDIIDGRKPHAVLQAMKNTKNLGTCFVKG